MADGAFLYTVAERERQVDATAPFMTPDSFRAIPLIKAVPEMCPVNTPA